MVKRRVVFCQISYVVWVNFIPPTSCQIAMKVRSKVHGLYFAVYIRKLLPVNEGTLLNLLSKVLKIEQAFGQALRSHRIKRKWSQTDLALRAAVDRNYISLIELGKSSPSLGMIYRLCDALDVRPTELLKDVDNRIRYKF